MGTEWYRFAYQNREAVNGSQVGCRIKGIRPSEREMGRWISAMGIVLKRHNVDGTQLPNRPLKEKKLGLVPNRQRQSVFRVNIDKMQAFTDIIKRRYLAGQRRVCWPLYNNLSERDIRDVG